jgi:hypothetical protein
MPATASTRRAQISQFGHGTDGHPDKQATIPNGGRARLPRNLREIRGQHTRGRLSTQPFGLNIYASRPSEEMRAHAARCALVSFTATAGRCSVRK